MLNPFRSSHGHGESDGSVELVSLQGKRRKFDAAWQETCEVFFNDLWEWSSSARSQ